MTKRTGFLFSFTLPLSFLLHSGVAQAHVNGAGECRTEDGEYPKVVWNTVHSPVEVVGSQRGDVLLTRSSREGAPVKALLTAIDQYFSHAVFVSETQNYQSWITHATSLEPGKKVYKWIDDPEHGWVYGVDPHYLGNLMPGNMKRMPAKTLLHGRYTTCLDAHSPAECMNNIGATPKDLHRGSTMLLSPRYSRYREGIEAAEAYDDHEFVYGLSAYSDYTDFWENQWGTVCSGFVGGSLRDAGAPIQVRTYPAAERALAILALYNQLYSNALNDQGFIKASIGRPLLRQVTNCFAEGSKNLEVDGFYGIFNGEAAICKNFGSKDLLEQGNLFLLGLWAGEGDAISPDNLIPRAISQGVENDELVSKTTGSFQRYYWAKADVAEFRGGHSYRTYSHLECCKDGEGTGLFGEPLEDCRRVDDNGRNSGGFGTSPFPSSPFPSSPIPSSSSPTPFSAPSPTSAGTFVEYSNQICYESKSGKICSPLSQ